MRQLNIIIHSIAEDGYPDMDKLTGRVAFLFDGCIVSGWPLFRDKLEGYAKHGVEDGDWEANSDVGRTGIFRGVTHWVEFSIPLHNL